MKKPLIDNFAEEKNRLGELLKSESYQETYEITIIKKSYGLYESSSQYDVIGINEAGEKITGYLPVYPEVRQNPEKVLYQQAVTAIDMAAIVKAVNAL